jgi:hypothetical protein
METKVKDVHPLLYAQIMSLIAERSMELNKKLAEFLMESGRIMVQPEHIVKICKPN